MTKLIFEKSSENRQGVIPPPNDTPNIDPISIFGKELCRKEMANLPEVSEHEVIRHYIELSTLNYHVDKGLYPLGSCTMKHNPRINEVTSSFDGFSKLHPLMPQEEAQGALELMYNLGEQLKEISGFESISLQPVAGAHGEQAALMVVKAFHTDNGNPRKIVLVPDSAHGTNPASASRVGYAVKEVKSLLNGMIDVEDLKAQLNEEVAVLMITNPNTLGIFEENIHEIASAVHNAGALLYMDGANLNALMGRAKAGKMGFDLMHFNLHKTFSTPHGGGGPGAGPIGVTKELEKYLPLPAIDKLDNGSFTINSNLEKSVGRMHSFYGNFSIMVRAYTYILMCGGNGLKDVTDKAVLNANYLRSKLKDIFSIPCNGDTLHEFVASAENLGDGDIRALDVAKYLIDHNFYAPTIYFPLIVKEAIMIEPTETESIEELDRFINRIKEMIILIKEDPEKVKSAPFNTPVRRLNETMAAKNLKISYFS